MALYPEELIELLDAFLTDGEISDRERAALLKRAEKCGVDPEEFDLYIDSKVQKIEKSNAQSFNDDENDSDDLSGYTVSRKIHCVCGDEEFDIDNPLFKAEAEEAEEAEEEYDDDAEEDEEDYDEDDYEDDEEENSGFFSSFKGLKDKIANKGRSLKEAGTEIKDTLTLKETRSRLKETGSELKDALTMKEARESLKDFGSDLKDAFSFGFRSSKKSKK